MPSLENLHLEFKNEPFKLLLIDVKEKKETVQRFIQKKSYSFRNLVDEDGRVSAQYGVRSHPMKFLVNKEGKLIGVARGYREWDTEEMKSLVRLLIDS